MPTKRSTPPCYKLAFNWLRSSTDPFAETGGASPVSGSGVTANRIRMLIGGELGHSWLAGRNILDFSVYGRLVDNLAQNIGTLAISDATIGSPPQFIAGITESTLGADAGAEFLCQDHGPCAPLCGLRRPISQQSCLARRNHRRRVPLVAQQALRPQTA